MRYRVGGRQHRRSLGTKSRKVAEALRRQQEVRLFEAERREVLSAHAGGEVSLAMPALGTVDPAVLASMVAELLRAQAPAQAEPEAVPERPSLVELRERYEEWSTAHKRPKTRLNDRLRLDAFFAQVQVERLDQVTVADCERFIGQLAMEGKSPATILRHREILHALFRWAERCGYVDRNPVSATRRPRLPDREPRFLSLADIQQVLEVLAGDRIEVLVAVALFAGLRREELCWLTWEDVRLDAEPGMLLVRAKRVGRESWQPKTGKDRRVPVSARLRAYLEQHRQARSGGGGPWLFQSPGGCRWDPDNLGRHLRQVMAKNELRWNFLEMRHTFGSQLAQKGVSLVKIAALMGNSPDVARRHYINLSPEEMAVDVEF